MSFKPLKRWILRAEKYMSISWKRLKILFRSSSEFKSEMLCPCSLINGMNMLMIPIRASRKMAITITTEITLGNFNLSVRILSRGRATSDKIPAMTRYTMTDWILYKKKSRTRIPVTMASARKIPFAMTLEFIPDRINGLFAHGKYR
jgi:hypothetical protein